MPKILKRTLREKGPEKDENTYFMKMWTWSLSRKLKSIQKLDPVLKQGGLSSLSNCFKRATHVPPFNIDGFETRNEKLVCNVLKKN